MIKNRALLLSGSLLLWLTGHATPSLGAVTDSSSFAIVGPAVVVLGQSVNFDATVPGGDLQWSVNGVPGGTASSGVIQNGGLYQAPAAVPAGGAVTITCSDDEGDTVSKVITLVAPLVIIGPASVNLSQSVVFSVTSQSSSLKWSVNGIPGGNATVGIISSSGQYTAPSATPTNPTIVISCADAYGLTAYKFIELVASQPITQKNVVEITGPSVVVLGQSATFVVKPSGDAVSWSVNNIVGGSSAIGTITSNGVYRAPNAMPNGNTVTISCTNASRQSAYQTIELMNASSTGGQTGPLVVSGPTAVILGQEAAFSLASPGSDPIWSVNGIVGGNASVGTINGRGLYQAPASMPAGGTVTIGCKAGGQSGSRAVSLLKPLVITGPNTVALSQSVQFTANSSGTVLQWSVNGLLGGNAVVGFIQPNGAYQAPASIPPANSVVIGCLDANGQIASQVVQIATPLAITGPSSLNLGQSTTFSVTPVQQALQWSVNGTPGGNASVGVILKTGVYATPASMPAGASVTISCKAADGLSASVSLALQNPPPSITNAQLTAESIVTSRLTITGSGFNSTSTVSLNGKTLTATLSSSTVLYADVMASALQVSPLAVQVTNPIPGGGPSNIVELLSGLPASVVTTIAAARLLDQATFGPTMADIQHVQSVGLQGYLNEQFNEAPSSIPPFPLYSNLADCRPFLQCFTDGWWFRYAMWGPDQLRQKVAFALSEQWVVSYVQVEPTYFPSLLNIFANDAFANWRTLMQDVTTSSAMGTFLDMVNSQKPAPGEQADQNYAREVMQLFNLGPTRLNQDGTPQLDASGNAIAVYSAGQIDAFARAFTGWTYASPAESTPCSPKLGIVLFSPTVSPGGNCPMTAVEKLHDTTEKALLDDEVLPAGQSAEEDLKQALDNIFNDPNLPPFVSKQLIQHLVTSNPSSEYIERVANVFADDGTGVRGDMKAVITAILLDPEARADDAGGQASAAGGKLREPLLWAISLMRSLGGININPLTLHQYGTVLNPLSGTGQVVHDSPDVFGYFSPSYTIPGTAINGPEFELESSTSYPLEEDFIEQLVGGYLNNAVYVDCTAAGTLGKLAAADPQSLIEYLNIVLLHGNMSDDMRNIILKSIQGATPDRMVRMAVFLIATSPQYKVMV